MNEYLFLSSENRGPWGLIWAIIIGLFGLGMLISPRNNRFSLVIGSWIGFVIAIDQFFDYIFMMVIIDAFNTYNSSVQNGQTIDLAFDQLYSTVNTANTIILVVEIIVFVLFSRAWRMMIRKYITKEQWIPYHQMYGFAAGANFVVFLNSLILQYAAEAHTVLVFFIMIAGCLLGGAIGAVISKKLYSNTNTHLCLHVLTVGVCLSVCVNGITMFAFFQRLKGNLNQIDSTMTIPSPWTTELIPFILGCLVATAVQVYAFKGQTIDRAFGRNQGPIPVQSVTPSYMASKQQPAQTQQPAYVQLPADDQPQDQGNPQTYGPSSVNQ